MLRVVYSNQLEPLADSLAKALPRPRNPFARATVVVPGRLVARWVQYAVAARRGVAAQLELPFLEALLADAFADREVGLRGLDRPRLGAVVASVLADPDVVAEPAMARVAEYLDDEDDGARAVRRVQLAGRVASLFWDYALTRPEWLDAWEAGADPDTDRHDEAQAAWQARIWREVTTRLGEVTRSGEIWTPVPRLPRVRRRLGLAAPAWPRPVHVVGFSYLARTYLDALQELSETTEVTIYMLNPCAEFWEDVPGRIRGRRARALPSRPAVSEVELADDPAALRLWGRPARDTVAALIDRAGGDFMARFVDPGDATAVHAMLRDNLARLPSSELQPEAPGALEPGLMVLGCPSLTRELEIVGSEIWRLLHADPTLRASDIAVLVAGSEADRYLAQLPAVFAGLGELPYHLVDLPLAEHGRVGEGALLLLELPLGRFTRPELLGLMTHPAVLARHRHVDPDDWVRWAERLGIVHGASAQDHAGTYLEGHDLFHWDQGVRRLALGAFMAAGRSGADSVAVVGDAPCLPEEIAPDDQASAATFALLSRSLIADATWLREQALPLARWAEVLEALVASYLGGRDEEAARELARVRRELAGLADLDLDGRALGYREVVELARQRLGCLRGDRGEALADGVLVGPLTAMRPLPFRVVFCLGLGEGRFPAADPPSPLDLRDTRRGDVPERDRDRYAFFEALLSVRDRLVLSYVARDAKTGEALGPSSVVVELADMLAPYLGHPHGAAALAALTVEHRLRRWDPAYAAPEDPRLTPSAASALVRERWAAQVRANLVAHLTHRGRPVPEPDELRAELGAGDHDALRAALRVDVADHVPATPADDATRPLSLVALRRFLESPVQAWAETVLRLDTLDDEDPVRRQDEPFGTAAAQRAALLREVFALHVGAAGGSRSIEDAYRAVAERRRLAGQAPVGVFGDAETERDLELLREWSREVGTATGWRRFAFGRTTAPGATLLPPIAIEVELGGVRRSVELVGQTELIADPVGSVILAVGSIHLRHHLRGAVDHLALAATGLAERGHRHLVLAPKGERVEVAHIAWSAAQARQHLSTLCAELLGQRHAYLLSLDMVKSVKAGKAPVIERPREGQPGSLGWGPVRRADALRVPADWKHIVARRWDPILDRMPEVLGGGRVRRGTGS